MNHRHRERGSAIAETAMVLVVAMMLVFGIIDFGRLIYAYHTIASMARQGARWAMVRGNACGQDALAVGATQTYCSLSANTTGCAGGDQCASAADIQTYVQSLPIGIITPSSVTVDTTSTDMWPGTGCTGGAGSNTASCPVAVKVSYPFNFFLPYMPKMTITLSSTSTMIIAQ
jgi:Flp pilus assembly protein TadG